MVNPLTPLDLIPLPTPSEFIHREGVSKADFVKIMHERVKHQIHKQIERYKREKSYLRKRDWVWLHLSNARFPKTTEVQTQHSWGCSLSSGQKSQQ